MKMKIVVLDGYTLNPGDLDWGILKNTGNCEIFYRTPPEMVYQRSKEAEIILTNKVVFNRDMIKRLPELKYIGVLATGYNVVDVEAAKESGIVVTNIPAYSTDSVAQMVFAHILNFTQRVEVHSESVCRGDWTNCIDFMYQLTPQTELANKVLGIVGFGRIGQAVARIGIAFGMKVIYQNRSPKKAPFDDISQVGLNTVFKESDFISINCPLTDENIGFVNSKLLSFTKPSVFIVNTGRGPLLNEKDVADALNSGRIAGLGVDVLSTEPPKNDNPLLAAKNCFITPHIAWATREARRRLLNIAGENIRNFMEGHPVNVIN